MSAITPRTELRLIKCPIESDNRNQLTFSNETAQYNYFNSLPHLEVDNFTYQRKDSVIRYPDHIDNILSYNYVMYRNDNYSDKWFYAFITKMEYVNDNMTYITIKTDVYQTWMFQMVWKRSFIEREHVNDDTIGANTIPEQLETGDYVCSNVSQLYTGNHTYICIACSDVPSELGLTTTRYYNGVFSGTEPFLFRDYQAAANFVTMMSADAKGEAIVSVFLAPQELFSNLTLNWQIKNITISGHTYTFEMSRIPSSNNAAVLNVSDNITPPSTIDGYTPKNNKLKTSPYSYFYISNNVGSDVPFKYEDFVSNTASFKTVGSLTPGCSIRCVPLNYKKYADTNQTYRHYNSGVTLAKYPICSWSNDVYTNWLTQNGVNLGFKVAGGVIGVVAGAALTFTGGGAGIGIGMIGGGLGMITDTVKEVYQHSLTPDQAQGNSNAGDVTYSIGRMDILCYKMTIRNEIAKVIDNYFSMFGYKVHIVKLPNITGRVNWNYVKTIGANIEGDIPEDDLNEIKEIFNRGVTLWHNPSTYLDYSQNNAIA
jgi:hypothetical protein